jgi:NAD(P)-dependent dehydrogenase (short-subunit alcohol dehydrogenase family)
LFHLTTDIGTSSIGKATCEALATLNPAQIIMMSRNAKEAGEVIEHIHATQPNIVINFIPCDLSSFSSIRQAVADFTLLASRLDLLICNSRICMVSPAMTEDGYEIQMGTNHLGHALLIKLLMPTLLKTAAQQPRDVRVIIVSSRAHTWAPKGGVNFEDLQTTQGGLTSKQRYGQSKLANILYARELARRYPAIKAVSLYPGTAESNIVYHLKKKYLVSERLIRWTSAIFNKVYRMAGREMLTAEEAARSLIWAATVPTENLASGKYYEPVGVIGQVSEVASDIGMVLATQMWHWTQRIVTGVPFEAVYTLE